MLLNKLEILKIARFHCSEDAYIYDRLRDPDQKRVNALAMVKSLLMKYPAYEDCVTLDVLEALGVENKRIPADEKIKKLCCFVGGQLL